MTMRHFLQVFDNVFEKRYQFVLVGYKIWVVNSRSHYKLILFQYMKHSYLGRKDNIIGSVMCFQSIHGLST